MALGIGTLTAFLRLDDSSFTKKIDTAAKKLKETSQEMMEAAVGIGLIAGSLAAVGAHAIKAASDFDETTNLIQVGYGSASQEAEKWAATTAQAMGRSTQQMRNFGGSLQVMLAPMVGSQTQADAMSKKFAELAVDLGSFFNVADDDDALLALKSGLTGELEPLKKFGLTMTEASLKSYALSKGMKANLQTMSEAEKVQLRYAYILDHTTLAQGDAERTGDSFANQLKRLQGNVDNLAVSLGGPLKTALAPLLKGLNDLGAALADINPGTVELLAKVGLTLATAAGVIAGLLGAGGAIGMFVAVLPTIIGGMATLFSTILPIVAILATVALAVGWVYKAWKAYGDSIVETAGDVGTGIKESLMSAIRALGRGFDSLVDFIVKAFVAIPNVIFATFDLIHVGMIKLLAMAKPLAEKLGFGDAVSDSIRYLSEQRQEIARTQSAIESFGENVGGLVKDTFSLDSLADSASSVVDTGKKLAADFKEGVLFGLEGLTDMLGDVFGVALNQAKAALPPPGKDQTLPGGAAPPVKLKPELDDVAWASALKSAELDIYNSFSDAVHKAMKDTQLWAGFGTQVALALSDALIDVSKTLPNLISKNDANLFGADVLDFLGTDRGKAVAMAAGEGADALLGGNLDLGTVGSVIGTAIAPGIGSTIGKSVGEGIGKIAEVIGNLTSQVVEGITTAVSKFGQILLSGAQRTSGVVSAVQGGADIMGTLLSVAAAGAALAAIAAVAAVVVAVLIPLVPLFLAVNVVLVALAVALAPVIIALGVLLSPLIALAAVVAGLVLLVTGFLGAFAVILQLGAMSEKANGAFKEFSLALEWGARMLIQAAEPIYNALLPLAGLFITFAEAIAPLITTFIKVSELLGVFDLLFEGIKFVMSALMSFGLFVLEVSRGLIDLLHALGGMSDEKWEAAADTIAASHRNLRASLESIQSMTMEQATATAIAGASLERLAEAADEASGNLNLPEAFKLAAARNNAIIGGLGDADGPTLPADAGAPTVNVYINGELWETLEARREQRQRFHANITTGIPVVVPKRRWGTPRGGN